MTISRGSYVPQRHPVTGWTQPAWATEVRYDEPGVVTFVRVATGKPAGLRPDGMELEATVSLVRIDEISLDSAAGSMVIEQGQVVIHFDIEELTVSEARTLADALLELCAAAGLDVATP